MFHITRVPTTASICCQTWKNLRVWLELDIKLGKFP